jgi:diguanylate cyclase (GGDEF)-like protein
MISLVNENMTQATTHTYLVDGRLQDNFSYSITETPCHDVIQENFCFIPENVQALYPDDLILRHANIESYAGIIIKNITGSAIGILIAISKNKLEPKPQINALMRIFSERIAGEMRRAEDQEKIFNLAFFDPLTQLPNRRFLQERLKIITTQSKRTGQSCAILFIDLDNFKFLNDSRGHHVGDQLLTLVSERIRNVIRSTDLAARLGGDEFVVIFDNLSANTESAAIEAKKRAEELHAFISLPYPLLQTVYHCTISMGVNIFCGTERSIDDLLRHADLAMYQAKDSGRNAIRFFDPQMQLQMELRASIENDLRVAIEVDNQLLPYYQIQVHQSGEAIGAELLLRWQHPTKGMISPADFIPIAEQTGLIIPMGRKVLQMACDQLIKWKDKPGFNQLKLAVNVSPIQFNQNEFVHEIISFITNNRINAELLTLEITEGSLLQNMDASINKMLAIKAHKIGFAMDDFGIGYSSLSYLKKLPLNQLKIDQSFVRDISTDPNDRVIVRTIIAMAQNLELESLAEGVETLEQKNYLIENGCKKFQGYYFGRPAPIKEFEEKRFTFL